MSGIWGKHRGRIPLNGSSDSQVIGRGGCDRGLLGHVCACARVLMCMLGCLSNLVVVGFFKEKTFPLAVARTGGSSLPPSQSPPPSFPCPVASRLREKHCIQLASGTSPQEVVSRAWERSAVLQLALFLHGPPSSCIMHLLLPPGL